MGERWLHESCYTWAFDESAPLSYDSVRHPTIADRLLEPTSTHTLSFTFLSWWRRRWLCLAKIQIVSVSALNGVGFWTTTDRDGWLITRQRHVLLFAKEERGQCRPTSGEKKLIITVFIFMLIDRRIFQLRFLLLFLLGDRRVCGFVVKTIGDDHDSCLYYYSPGIDGGCWRRSPAINSTFSNHSPIKRRSRDCIPSSHKPHQLCSDRHPLSSYIYSKSIFLSSFISC